MQNKLQKVSDGTNVIVELKGSSNRCYSHLNKIIKDLVVLSNDEVLVFAEKNMSRGDKLNAAKEFISKIDNYAKSQSANDDIKHGDIVKFEYKMV